LYVSRSDWRIQCHDAVDEFINPHFLTCLGRANTSPELLKRAIIAPPTGQWEEIFCLNG
jgi:hypothetical protein